MRFFTSFAVAALAAVAAANSKANPFNIPTDGYTFKVGEPTTFTWKPTTSGTVTLRLQWGSVTTATSGTAIASNIDNSGSYTWDVPSNLAAQPDYTIEIISDEDSNDYNFIGRFTVEGATVSVTSATATSTTAHSTSESTSSSTPTTTSESTSSSSASSSSNSSSSATTLTTATSTSASSTGSSTASSSATTESSSSAASSTAATSSAASQSAVPTTDSGAAVANRVSGGMLALVAGAFLL
ncbi:unnamed protein product [Penicillium salamii]|uniref:Yeast cell wall synthesis Kre9/Knh1-like N-terminal domain-containing protein n=1 Tax=Penicillium salamii TaxID=1612424 RepID=A0A9W4IFV2_9EURO|nr:unnamed protein product [Penicillium salamii]CAG8037488.1 unnamed protein product [Penicillium salamii]CAG8090520.1 unnamed protein product [Penicillium salamii]CAG8164010.1 unnamed protein product [Penicillium salamii]CAG8206975.1 unnamed protein product [Penicillium salamii]